MATVLEPNMCLFGPFLVTIQRRPKNQCPRDEEGRVMLVGRGPDGGIVVRGGAGVARRRRRWQCSGANQGGWDGEARSPPGAMGSECLRNGRAMRDKSRE